MTTFYEQVPVETVKAICQEKSARLKGRSLPVPDNDSSDGLKYPEWQTLLQEALLEFEPGQLRARIATAESVISARQDLLSGLPDTEAERQAINDGFGLLRLLKERFQRTA